MFKRRDSLALHLVPMTAAGSLLAALSLVAGCGQKGDLTLPEPMRNASPAAAPSSAPSPASK